MSMQEQDLIRMTMIQLPEHHRLKLLDVFKAACNKPYVEDAAWPSYI